MRRIVLPILSLLAVACSSDIDEVTFDEVTEEVAVVENSDKTVKDDVPNEPSEADDNNPSIFAKQSFTVAEHSSTGTTIGFLDASDSDGDPITYALESKTSLIIDENTGEITIGNDMNLDFERMQNLEFSVSAFDGKAITEKTFNLTIQDVDEVTLLTEAQRDLISYFQFLTFWKEKNHTRTRTVKKWESKMRLHLRGNVSSEYRATVAAVIGQYNTLFSEGDFSVVLTENSKEANAELFFGDKEEIANIWPNMYEKIKDGNYSGYAMTPSLNGVLTSTRIWISNPIEALLKHELGHALGFGHSNKCDDEHSFLCSKISAQNDILPVEANIIRYLYHEDIVAGISEAQIEEALAHLIANER